MTPQVAQAFGVKNLPTVVALGAGQPLKSPLMTVLVVRIIRGLFLPLRRILLSTVLGRSAAQRAGVVFTELSKEIS